MSGTFAAAPVAPIRSPEDHERAKARIETLMQVADEGDKALYDELEVLSTLVEAYERDRFPLEAPSAVEAIRFRMEQRNLTQKDLEPFIGSRARGVRDPVGQAEVVGGHDACSARGAWRPVRGAHAEAEAVRPRRARGKAAGPVAPAEARLQDRRRRRRRLRPRSVRRYEDPGAEQEDPDPTGERGKRDPTALILWQAAILHEARRRDVAPFDSSRLTDDLLRDVARCSAEPDGPKRAIELLASHGITVVIVDVLPGTFLDGGAMLLDGERPVIGVTLRHDRIDGFWFTLLHELSHIQQHLEVLRSSGEAFLDELDLSSEDELERQADDGAARALIPANLAGTAGQHLREHGGRPVGR